MTSEQTNVYCDESEMVLMESSSLNEVVVDREVDVKEFKDHYAIAPHFDAPQFHEFDFPTLDDQYFPKFATKSEQRVPVIEVFSSFREAERVILALQRQGLASHQISIVTKMVTKNERDIKVSINCENIALSSDFLIEILDELEIGDNAQLRFVNALDDGKFLVMAIGTAWEATKALYVLHNIPHWHFIDHFKSILTFPL